MSATAASLTKLLAWRPGGYLRASGALIAVMTLAGVVSFAEIGQVPA